MDPYNKHARGQPDSGRDATSNKLTAAMRGLSQLAYPVKLICALLSTILSVGYLGRSIASDGLSGMDVAVIAAAFIAFFGIMAVLYFIGLKVLPLLRGERRTPAIVGWFAVCSLVICVSLPTALNFAGTPLAEAEQYRKTVTAALDQSADAIETARGIDSLIPVAANAAKTASGMKGREKTDGGVSNTGRGVGIVADTLASLETLTRSSQDALVSARAEAAPLIRRTGELADRVRRLSDAPDLTWAERIAQSKAALVELTLTVEALRRVAPIAALEGLVDGLTKDWLALGLNETAAVKIGATFEPIATRFSIALADLRRQLATPITRLSEKTGFALLTEHAAAVAPIAVFIILLDGLPLMIVALTLMVHGQTMNSPEPAPRTVKSSKKRREHDPLEEHRINGDGAYRPNGSKHPDHDLDQHH